MNCELDISLPRFDGPLDLLLHLVRGNEIDIKDIPIAEITRQYFEYIRQAKKLDIDLGAEFSYIAALLIHLKSRALLANDPEVAPDTADPRDELARLLIHHDQVRNGAEFLKQKLEIARATWSRPPLGVEQDAEQPLAVTMNLLDILRLAKEALETARAHDSIFPADSIAVKEMEEWLLRRTAGTRHNWSANQLLAEQASPERQSALFLAMLELAKTGRISLDQEYCFGPVNFRINGTGGTTVP